MKFLSVYKTVERTAPPTPEEMASMGKLIEEGMRAGWLLAVEGCMPSATGARVRKSNSKMSVTDGPFAETKELIAGFWIWQVRSIEEAVEWVKRCPNPMLTDSDIEIRPAFGPEDFAETMTPELKAQEADQRRRTDARL